MKYNIALDGVILDLLQQRFPECVFAKAKSEKCFHVNVRAKPPPPPPSFSLQERASRFIVCLDTIVKVIA